MNVPVIAGHGAMTGEFSVAVAAAPIKVIEFGNKKVELIVPRNASEVTASSRGHLDLNIHENIYPPKNGVIR